MDVVKIFLVVKDKSQDVHAIVHNHIVHALRCLSFIFGKNGFFEVCGPIVLVNLFQYQWIFNFNNLLKESFLKKLSTFKLALYFIQIFQCTKGLHIKPIRKHSFQNLLVTKHENVFIYLGDLFYAVIILSVFQSKRCTRAKRR